MPDLLSPKQLAEYLQLSQRTIYRLLERGDVPAIKVGGQWRFRKSAVDEWLDVTMHRLDATSLSALDADEEVVPAEPLRLAGLVAPENARIEVPAGARDAVVRDFVAQVRFPEPISSDLVTERVLERERMCSTATSGGVALLHTPRAGPRVLRAHDLVAIGRVTTPVDFGAFDGSRTDTLVLLLARTERAQLALHAKLTRLCQEPNFLEALRDATDGAAVIDLIRRTEDRLFLTAS